jgi:hypothetical protein
MALAPPAGIPGPEGGASAQLPLFSCPGGQPLFTSAALIADLSWPGPTLMTVAVF